jgi:3-isopropylmalate/(R)-2-methylmalate dehydratase small subunit
MSKAWVFGDYINTDNIFPTRFAADPTIEEMAKHVFADLRPEFAKEFKIGDVVIAGHNFGCGSLRETSIFGFKGLGSTVIAAKSFARGFIRNAVNNGIWLITLSDAEFEIEDGDGVFVDHRTGIIHNQRTGAKINGKPLSGLAAKIVEAGGATSYFKDMVQYPKKPQHKQERGIIRK